MDDNVRCLFCRTTTAQRSNEHVLRREFKKLIPTYGSILLERDMGPGLERVSRPQSPFEQMVNQVCRPCNHGWLNTLENRVVDLVVDLAYARPVVLTPESAAELAFWCTTRALLRTHGDRSTGGLADPAIFHAAYLLQAPPPGVEIHVGFCERYIKPAGSSSAGYVLGVVPHPDGTFTHSIVATTTVVSFGIGAFYFQVALPSDYGAARREVAASMAAVRGAYPDKFMTLHPTFSGEGLTALGVLTAEEAGRCGNPAALRGRREYLPSDIEQMSETMPTPVAHTRAKAFWQSQRP